MKLFHLGSKIKGFATSLGNKIYSGSKYIGQKVYDNRYKIAGATVGLAAAAAGSKVAYDKALPYAYDKQPMLRQAIDTYAQMNNPGERTGFRKQIVDAIGSQVAGSLLINPYAASKFGRQNAPLRNDNWD